MSAPDPDREIAHELRLRADAPVVARLSRRSLGLLAGAGVLAIAAVVGWSLGDHHKPAAPEATQVEEAVPPPAQLNDLPRDYATPPKDVPKLGPPLPGDLGRPIVEAGQGASVPGGPTSAAADPAVQQALAEAKQARGSRLAVFTSARPAAPAPTAAVEGPTTSAVTPAATTYVLRAGSLVRAALLTGVRSDVPGQVVAQVTEDVFDSQTGRWKLIPQGARLIGRYEDKVAFGQDRVQLTWTRLLLPDGRSIDLGGEPAVDAVGVSGVTDRAERHWGRLIGASLVSSMLAMGAQAGAGPGDGLLLGALRTGAASTASQVGQQLVGRSLDVQPSLSLRAGLPVQLLLTKDLVLEAWRS